LGSARKPRKRGSLISESKGETSVHWKQMTEGICRRRSKRENSTDSGKAGNIAQRRKRENRPPGPNEG